MGFELASLFVKITGNATAFNSAAAAVDAKLTRTQGVMRSVMTAGENIFAQLAAGAGAAAIAFGALKTSIELESSLANLEKVVKLDAAGMKSMKDEIYELSTRMKGVKLESLIEMATAGAKLGIAAKDITTYTEGIAKVSTAITDIPAAQLADQMGKVNSVFKLGIQGTMQLGSAIVGLDNASTTSASQILAVTQRLSGTAVMAKITAQETAALATTLLDTGTHSELAATAIQHLIQNMATAKHQAGFAKTIGVDVETFAKLVEAKPMAAIEKFLQKLKGMSNAEGLAALKLSGFEGAQGSGEIQKLALKVNDLAGNIKVANDEFKSLNAIESAYNITAKTTEAEITVISNQWKILADTVVSDLVPAVAWALKAVNGLAVGIGNIWRALSAEIKKEANIIAKAVREVVGAADTKGDLLPVSAAADMTGGKNQDNRSVAEQIKASRAAKEASIAFAGAIARDVAGNAAGIIAGAGASVVAVARAAKKMDEQNFAAFAVNDTETLADRVLAIVAARKKPKEKESRSFSLAEFSSSLRAGGGERGLHPKDEALAEMKRQTDILKASLKAEEEIQDGFKRGIGGTYR